jgi:hypothetical protein
MCRRAGGAPHTLQTKSILSGLKTLLPKLRAMVILSRTTLSTALC